MKFAFKINLSTYRVLVKKRGLTFESMRAKYAARIAGDSQTSMHCLLLELKFPWEVKA